MMTTPIDEYLSAQADLRVVERFARTDVAGRTGQWADLIPLSAPPPGEQYRFEVDLDSCSGCKACVTACHSLNGLDDGESFRSIGLLVAQPAGPADARAVPAEQTLTTACHHCADPGCLTGCPAEAYEKDPVTGIVKHLDDACIGCQYCTLTCPYEVPVYNDRLGIVRKCDLCADRLADDEAPACVQGCPTRAISVSTVATAEIIAAGGASLVPGAAPSSITVPTSRYRGALGATAAIDFADVTPQHAHLPLVVMLVLSQWSVGILATAPLWSSASGNATLAVVVTAAVTAVASATASFAHLGQPLKAWRAVLGWSHSWLSREVLAISAYIGLVLVGAGAIALDVALAWVAGTAALVAGMVAVGCSTMIYAVTGRVWWRLPRTAVRFGGTALAAFFALAALVATADQVGQVVGVAAALGVAAVAGVRLVAERAQGSEPSPDTDPSAVAAARRDLARTAALVGGVLWPWQRARLALAGAGSGLLLASAVLGTGPVAITIAAVALLALIGADMAERRLFFAACAPATMPGSHR